jgi:hypothetical protein
MLPLPLLLGLFFCSDSSISNDLFCRFSRALSLPLKKTSVSFLVMMSAPLLEPESGYPCAAIGPIEIRIVSQTDIIIISALIAQLQEQREKAPPEEVVPQFDSSGDSTTTKSESPTPKPAPPPDIPNGGLQAWCQVAGSFFLFFNGP